MVVVPRCMDQPTGPWHPICDKEKKQEQIAFGVNREFYQIQFFLAEVLHIRGIFSSCLTVLQISRTLECLMTHRHKNVEFSSSTCKKCFTM